MPRSGGGLSGYFPLARPTYQEDAVTDYLYSESYPHFGRYKYAPCRDLTFSYFVICAALMVVVTPMSLRKRSVAVSRTVLNLSRQARPAQFQSVFPYSLLLPLSVVRSRAPS